MSIEFFLSEACSSPRTVAVYRYFLGRFEAAFDLATVSPADIRKFCIDQRWAPSTTCTAINILKSYSRFAFGAEHPLTRMKNKRRLPPPGTTFTLEDLNKLMEACKKRPRTCERDQALLWLAFETGLRANELRTLSIDNLDLQNLTLKVIQKGGNWKTCVFSEKCREYLKEWLSERLAYRAVRNVFVAIGGHLPMHALGQGGVWNIIKDLCRIAGVEGSPHSIRRLFATEAFRRGAPLPLVMRQGGWRDAAILERYIATLGSEDFREWLPKD